jgi:hypothetical protein
MPHIRQDGQMVLTLLGIEHMRQYEAPTCTMIVFTFHHQV